MATIEDLLHELERRPDDHDIRWRLAKKQYMACEYRDALNNLLTLKEEWNRKQNVLRYLGATYYRLGQYKQAIAELEDAIAEWPDEMALREQLARVYEVAGRREEAAEVWQSVLLMEPNHPIAGRAIDRLQHAPTDTPQDDLRLHDSDSGISMLPVVVCTACGAHNSEDFERCWQCHALLTGDTASHDPDSFTERGREDWAARMRLVAGVALVAVLSVSVYLTVRYVLPAVLHRDPPVSATVSELLLRGLAAPRGLMGLVLVVVWTGAAVLVRTVTGGGTEPRIAPPVFGLTLAGAAYCASWLPVTIAPIAIGLIGIAAIALTPFAMGLSTGRGIAAGIFHTVPALAAGSLAFTGLAGTDAWAQWDTIQAYASDHDNEPEAGLSEPYSGSTKFTAGITFESSGSEFLDSLAHAVAFEVTAPTTSPPLLIEFRDANELIDIADVTQSTTTLITSVKPGQPYRLIVSGQEGKQVTVRAKSVLKPKITS